MFKPTGSELRKAEGRSNEWAVGALQLEKQGSELIEMDLFGELAKGNQGSENRSHTLKLRGRYSVTLVPFTRKLGFLEGSIHSYCWGRLIAGWDLNPTARGRAYEARCDLNLDAIPGKDAGSGPRPGEVQSLGQGS